MDRKLDIAVSNGCADQPCTRAGGAGIFLGNGDGSFQSVIVHNGVGQGQLVLADLNFDEIPDLVTAVGLRTTVMLGMGDGNFSAPNYYPFEGVNIAHLTVADVNSDGKPDLVTFGGAWRWRAVGVATILLGNGDGTFQFWKTYDTGGGGLATFGAVADVNGDAIPDLISRACGPLGQPCSATGGVSIRSGKGNGAFASSFTFHPSGGDGVELGIADLNDDSRLDLVVANFFGNDIGVLVNDGIYPTKAILSSNMTTSVYGQAVTLTTTITSASPTPPTGTVVFRNGAQIIGTATPIAGVASLVKRYLPVGTLSLTATYQGDMQTGKSASVLAQQVNPAPSITTLKASINPSVVGQPVTFTAKVTSFSAWATGTVTFKVNGEIFATLPLVGQKASITTSELPPGKNWVTAFYVGTPKFLASKASLTQIAK